ncbi:uncharacterized protein LOC126682016 [Mercurialis annua]|uniref:uncharacterized protein LOC126682016 n=1 Tax=Mercurialis annua TaxID=3986 RepID=UPI00215F3F27|nr:uncharacterized protein LOC126682016 [Mercurialis annua]
MGVGSSDSSLDNVFIIVFRPLSVSSIISKACEQHQEYLKATQKRTDLDGMTSNPSTVQSVPSAWLPPPTGCHKVNFDGAIDMNSKMGAIGFVVSDFAGKIVFTRARRFLGIVIPIVIEALALQTLMEEVLHTRYSNPIFERDCQVLIDAVSSSSSNDQDAGVILEDILSLVFRFSEIRFQYVNRNCYWVTHLVARKALFDDCFCRSHHSILE